MSVYLLLALAFGTMSGAVATPVSRPAPALVAQASGADRQVVRCSAIAAPQRSPLRFVRVGGSQLGHEAPLTGAASPRAPSGI